MLCGCMLFGCSDNKAKNDSLKNESKNESTTTQSSAVTTNKEDFDWSQEMYSKQSDPAFYMLFPKGVRPYNCCTGASTTPIIDDEVVLIVDNGDKDFSADYEENPFTAKTVDDILGAFPKTFDKIIQNSGAFFASSSKENYYEVLSTEHLTVNAVSKSYETCKTTGTYYCVKQAADSEDTGFYFVAYSTFLADNTPVLCAAIDSSDEQSSKEKCDEYALSLMQGLEEVPADFFT